MTTTNNTARLHTHFKRVVVSLANGECVYMDPSQAMALAKELKAFAKDINEGKHRCTRLVVNYKATNESDGKTKPNYV